MGKKSNFPWLNFSYIYLYSCKYKTHQWMPSKRKNFTRQLLSSDFALLFNVGSHWTAGMSSRCPALVKDMFFPGFILLLEWECFFRISTPPEVFSRIWKSPLQQSLRKLYSSGFDFEFPFTDFALSAPVPKSFFPRFLGLASSWASSSPTWAIISFPLLFVWSFRDLKCSTLPVLWRKTKSTNYN